MEDEHLKEWKSLRDKLENTEPDKQLLQEYKTTRLNSLDRLISAKEENA